MGNSRYLPSGQKNIIFGQKRPQQTILLRKVTIYLDIYALLGPISCPRNPNRVQNRFPYIKIIVGTWRSTHVIFNLVKKSLFLVKNVAERKKSKKIQKK